MKRFPVSVLFGGTGFIGSHFARHLLANDLTACVYVVDLHPFNSAVLPVELQNAARDGRIRYVQSDVRRSLQHSELPDQADLIANFAAVHREPGHEPWEYFTTNLLGAENVCAWAEQVGCPWIVFTSSIAPYGPTEECKDETAVPMPATPYGSSKLAAEKIHLTWQRGGAGRRLTIVRPGVVFGPGEGGNLTRLIRAVLGKYFFYMGNRYTRKAGGYVKELCHALTWVMERQHKYEGAIALFNFTMNPAPTVEEYVATICKVAGVRRFIPALPYRLLLGVSYPIEALSRPLGIQQPISPVRIHKLVHSNNIEPRVLREEGYTYHYTLESALADWREERPEDWR
ncbi:MAG: NAD-dependent epimerase/dehydratase family protein [Candidatus Binatia bacterium]